MIVGYIVSGVALLLSMPGFRHIVYGFVLWGAPDRAWARNYGVAVAMCVLSVFFPRLIPLPTFEQQLVAYKLIFAFYCAAMATTMWLAPRLALAVGGVNGSTTVRVADKGPAVSADALPHLFEPFFSLKQSGTGLGLAIARRIVEAHGGHIVAAPVSGGGLAFEIELPAW